MIGKLITELVQDVEIYECIKLFCLHNNMTMIKSLDFEDIRFYYQPRY